MNVAELAVYLSVSKDTIRGWVKKGQIPFSKIGGSVRFDMRKIEKWLKSKECDLTNKTYI